MYINSDNQTFNDLSIAENVYGEKSLFSLFDDTCSGGGRKQMKEWIMHPMNDLQSINERIEAICYNDMPDLTINREELDFIEYYLGFEDKPTNISRLNSSLMLFVRKFRNDPNRYVVERGTELIKKLFYDLKLYAENVTENSPVLIQAFARTILDAFQLAELKKIASFFSLGKRGNYQTDYCDYFFRYKRDATIHELLNIVYQLDAIRTAHNVAVKSGFCYPELSQDKEFCMSGFYHPQIKNAVKNNWEIKDGNICVFTGSNMAGKSTTLKAIASTVWLAHAGLPVPASFMKCPLFDGIFTSVNLPDSLRDGRSHFYAEVLRIKEILQKIREGKTCFVVFDELFRGTNASDAFEASEAVIDILKKEKGSIFLISTHIIELANSLQSDKACCFCYLESEIKDDRLVCCHKLKTGISESRVGYWIVKKELLG